jgi:hypothetical protein
MGAFLDRFEGLILNYARRVISFTIILAMALSVLFLVVATLNYMASPSADIRDSFDIPEFEEPVKPVAQKRAEPRQDQAAEKPAEPEWRHPMPQYESEIDNIVDSVLPLYIAYYGFDASVDSRRNLIGFVADQLKPYKKALSEDQMDDVVDGMEDYIDDFSDFHIDANNLDTSDLSQIEKKSDPQMSKALENPFRDYLSLVDKNFAALAQQVEQSIEEARASNAAAGQNLLVVSGALIVIVVLVLILVLFKAESSLRRSADVAEAAQNKSAY